MSKIHLTSFCDEHVSDQVTAFEEPLYGSQDTKTAAYALVLTIGLSTE